MIKIIQYRIPKIQITNQIMTMAMIMIPVILATMTQMRQDNVIISISHKLQSKMQTFLRTDQLSGVAKSMAMFIMTLVRQVNNQNCLTQTQKLENFINSHYEFVITNVSMILQDNPETYEKMVCGSPNLGSSKQLKMQLKCPDSCRTSELDSNDFHIDSKGQMLINKTHQYAKVVSNSPNNNI